MKTTITLIIGLALACAGIAQETNEKPRQALQSLMERVRDAKAAGRLDEAKALAEQAEKLQRELQGHEGMKKPDKHAEKYTGVTVKTPETERLQHVMQAVEHLRAAGLNEPAQGIEQIAQHLRQEIEERMKHQQAEAQAKEGKHHSEMKAHAELEEMRQQMRKMAEQIEQLQAELKKRGP